jgi:hypothetical protein
MGNVTRLRAFVCVQNLILDPIVEEFHLVWMIPIAEVRPETTAIQRMENVCATRDKQPDCDVKSPECPVRRGKSAFIQWRVADQLWAYAIVHQCLAVFCASHF